MKTLTNTQLIDLLESFQGAELDMADNTGQYVNHSYRGSCAELNFEFRGKGKILGINSFTILIDEEAVELTPYQSEVVKTKLEIEFCETVAFI